MDYRKIDVHCHTTNRPLSHTVQPDASLAFIQKEMARHNIARTLLLATYFPRKGTGISNFRMRNWMDAWKNRYQLQPFVMFGSLDFEHYFYQGLSELDEMASKKMIKGVKVYLGYQNIDFLKLRQVVTEICQKYDLPMMFHTGDCTGMGGAFADPDTYPLRQLFEQAPDVPFMFSHMANPMIDRVIGLIKTFPNCYTDMSGLLHSGKDDHELPDMIKSVKKFYWECGIDRLMFGTDFPVQTHAHSIEIAEKALHDICTEEELGRFYYGNASKLLKLG